MRQLVENRSAIQLQTSGLGAFFLFSFFFTLEHRRFRLFPCLRDKSENNLLGARFHRSTVHSGKNFQNFGQA